MDDLKHTHIENKEELRNFIKIQNNLKQRHKMNSVLEKCEEKNLTNGKVESK